MIKKFRTLTVALLLLVFFHTVYANEKFINRPDVKQYVDDLVKTHHFKSEYIYSLFLQVQFPEKVIANSNKPAEEMTWERYHNLLVSDQNIQDGVAFWNTHQKDLERAEKLYGVPASLIVSTIGIESRYGENSGKFRVIDSLTNLAFNYPRRAKFFKSELTEFLLLSRELNLDPLSLMGSYAGAIGQPQFMPSSYRRYAVDFSGKNHIDLIHNQVDVIGSIANYYARHGWKNGQPIATLATLADHQRPFKLVPADTQLTVLELKKYGIIPSQVVDNALKVRLVSLEINNNPQVWLTFSNFSVIKRYNPSTFYAMAVYQLADSIEKAKNKAQKRK